MLWMWAGMNKRPTDSLCNLVGGKQHFGETFKFQLQQAPWNNNVDIELDTVIMIYYCFSISSTCFGR
jgi:hypothetical protein